MPRGGKRKGAGRPKKPGCRQVSFWSSGSRITAYEKAAKKAGISRSKWLGVVADRAAGK